MKHSSTVYWIEADKNGKRAIIGHSQDKKTGEIYHEFLNRKEAVKLMDEERKVSPEYKYRLIKKTTTIELGPLS
jgi:hypothetical protein